MSTTQISSGVSWRRATSSLPTDRASAALLRGSAVVLRYGLVLLILWFGLFKFTATEAQSIQPLVAHSPLLSWLYAIMDVRGVSRLIGIAEIAIALTMAARPFSARLSALGSIGAIVMFVTTLSFLATTPGSWGRVDGVLIPTGAGAFLIKDLLLLGAAMWTAAEALARQTERR